MNHLATRLVRLGGAALVATATLAIPALPADASTSAYGVNHVDLEITPRFCPSPGGALPPGYGGQASCPESGQPTNTIYVEQVGVGGQWSFLELSGTGSTTNDVWFPAHYSAQCSGLRKLRGARIAAGGYSGATAAFEVSIWDEDLPVDTDHRTIPGRDLDLDVPIDAIQSLYDAMYPAPTSFADMGEHAIADLVAAGVPELDARTQSSSEVIHLDFSGEVLCSGSGRFRGASDAETTPIEIVFLGIGEEPGPGWRDATIEPPTRDQQVDDQLTVAPAVTQADLIVMADPADPCRLLLSGALATNEPMSVDYRFTDELGVPSQVFTVDVDHTQVAFLDHHVDLPVRAPSLDGDDGGVGELVARDPGGALELTADDTDREQGWYQLQVTAPHSLTSDIASYDVPPCTSGSEQAIATSRN